METTTPNEGQDNAPALKIDAVSAFNTTDAYLDELAKDYQALTIAGIDDKDGYKAAKEGKAKCRTLRNAVDKRRKELNKTVNGVAGTIQDKIEPIESHLDKQIAAIDKLIADKEAEEKARALKQFEGRTSLLFALKAAFNGAVYYLGTVQVTPDEVRNMSDEFFTKRLALFEAEAKKIADEEAAKVAEAEALQKKADDLAAKELLLKQKYAALGLDENGDPLPQNTPAETVSASETVNTTSHVPSVQEIKENKAAEVAKNMEALGTMGAPKTTGGAPSFLGKKVEEKVADPVQEPAKTEPAFDRSAVYMEGFNSCRAMILLILNNPNDKLTRPGLVEKVTNLTVIP